MEKCEIANRPALCLLPWRSVRRPIKLDVPRFALATVLGEENNEIGQSLVVENGAELNLNVPLDLSQAHLMLGIDDWFHNRKAVRHPTRTARAGLRKLRHVRRTDCSF